MQDHSSWRKRLSKICFQYLVATLPLAILLFSFPSWIVQKARADDSKTKKERALAQFSSWVLFGGRAVAGAPFLAYGFLSEIEALSRTTSQFENESSAFLTFVIEGTIVGMRQNPPVLLIESQGRLRFFFAAQAKRDFIYPDQFRQGTEVAAYDIQRRVLFDPTGGWLFDSTSARLVSSHDFTFNNTTKNLARLWGSQLVLQSRAHAGNGLPSPLPQFSGALPYSGKIFTESERTERQLPGLVFPVVFTATHPDSSAPEKN